MCREKKRDFNQKEADRLVLLSKKDPKEFWHEIKGGENREKNADCNFYEHFKNLANIESRVGEEGQREVNEGNREEFSNGAEFLDNPIEFEDLEIAIKGLKKNKSSGEDNLVNEFFLNAFLLLHLLSRKDQFLKLS